MRELPNILVSGTPGTGKSTLCKKLAKKAEGMTVVDFGKEAKAHGCREEYDEVLECWVIDEEKLADALTSRMESGGIIVDYMHANFWPDTAHIDLVITMHTNNTILYDRYTARSYSQRKIEENMDCEIMNVIGSENREYYDGVDEDGDRTMAKGDLTTTLVELQSDSEEDVKENVRRLVAWIKKWRKLRKEFNSDDSDEWEIVSIDEAR